MHFVCNFACVIYIYLIVLVRDDKGDVRDRLLRRRRGGGVLLRPHHLLRHHLEGVQPALGQDGLGERKGVGHCVFFLWGNMFVAHLLLPVDDPVPGHDDLGSVRPVRLHRRARLEPQLEERGAVALKAEGEGARAAGVAVAGHHLENRGALQF